MLKLETVNELTLKVTCQGGGDVLFTKTGAFISGECYGGKNYQFEKILLGVEGNPIQAAANQLLRRFTGENLPLTKVTMQGESITYYANEAQHVVVLKLQPGEQLNVESESILAFTQDCKYGVRFLGMGVLSQKGLATSTLTGVGANAYVAVLVDGNPIVLSNEQNGSTLEVDPDAMVAFTGKAEPGMKLDLSWKNILGSKGASGESYMFEWNSDRRTTVIIQPNERTSGLDVSMDGKRTGSKPTTQSRVSAGQSMNDIGSMLNGVGNMLGGSGNGNSGNGLSGLGGMLGL
jgi:uncharacterized protein (AIM24 family)